MDRHHLRKGSPQELATLGPSPEELAQCGPVPPALPAQPPRYVVPGSHWLDPAYYQGFRPTSPWSYGYPIPRIPWPGESETRAPGTGLLAGPMPCPPRHRHHHHPDNRPRIWPRPGPPPWWWTGPL